MYSEIHAAALLCGVEEVKTNTILTQLFAICRISVSNSNFHNHQGRFLQHKVGCEFKVQEVFQNLRYGSYSLSGLNQAKSAGDQN